VKAELGKRIVADFYSESDAEAAEEDFVRRFRNKQTPEDIEERSVTSGAWKLPRLLVELELAPSMAEARRLIEQGGVYIDGERAPQADVELSAERSLLLQVGKRRFVRVKGE